MAFHEVRFPTDISYGSRGGPSFNTFVVSSDSGGEERTGRWANSRHKYDASYGIRRLDQLIAVQNFYLRRSGALHGFRFKDFLDFTSAPIGDDLLAFNDQTIGTGDGSKTTFQLIKIYTDTAVSRTRNIFKPVAGTVKIGFDDVEQVSGFTVNTTNGIVTFTVAPALNVEVQAGYEFDVPVRFGEEVDQLLDVSIESFDSGSIPNIAMIELFDDVVQPDEFFFGGAKSHPAMAANISITPADGRVISVDPTSGALEVALPNPASLARGGPHFYVANINVTNSVLLTDHLGATLATIGTSSEVICLIANDSGGTREWLILA